jgi:hypothetical protein
MHAMQYEITLPAGYDMGIIRHRVATKGALLDTFPASGSRLTESGNAASTAHRSTSTHRTTSTRRSTSGSRSLE